MSDEDDLFGKAMQDVRRIRSEPRKVVVKKPAEISTQQGARQAHPVRPDVPTYRPESGDEPWTLSADGISNGRLRQLVAGRLPVDAESDLHGMTREGMYDALSGVLEHALDNGYRVLRVVHGRGLHSGDGRPVLKEALYAWLRDGPYAGWVLAVKPVPGAGGGAALVLLRRRRLFPKTR